MPYQDIHTNGILHTAYDVFCDGDDHRITPDRLKFLFKAIQGNQCLASALADGIRHPPFMIYYMRFAHIL
jgi:hypothetical protein